MEFYFCKKNCKGDVIMANRTKEYFVHWYQLLMLPDSISPLNWKILKVIISIFHADSFIFIFKNKC